MAEGGSAQAAPADAEDGAAGDGVGDVEQLLEEMDVEGEAGAAAGETGKADDDPVAFACAATACAAVCPPL